MSAVGRAWTVLRAEGLKSSVWRGTKYIANRYNPFAVSPLASVYAEDVIAADWSKPRDFNGGVFAGDNRKFKVAWIITPPGRTSGGHQNAFRFMSFLEESGHDLTVYLYQPQRLPVVSVPEVRKMMHETNAYPDLVGPMEVYDPAMGLAEGFEAVFAADWETAYAAYRYEGPAKRFYFTQDFEPAFFSAGSDYVLAENSYRLGFHGISAGRWLAKKLTAEYGMTGDYYDYAVDTGQYHYTNDQPRNEILFYARPPTPRRATEFGLLALQEFHRMRPDVVINLVGWDMSGYDVPFPFVNHTALDISQLNAIYNRCAAGLILSLTNMSLLPMEVMGSGVVPVVNDAENVRGVFESPYIEYVPMSPKAIADRLVSVIERPDAAAHAAEMAKAVVETNWSDPGETFIRAFEKAMRTAL